MIYKVKFTHWSDQANIGIIDCYTPNNLQSILVRLYENKDIYLLDVFIE